MSQSQYAINIPDLTKLAQGPGALCVQVLLTDVTSHRSILSCEKGRVDGDGVLLECETDRAEVIIAVLRLKQPNRNYLRCYRLGPRGGATRI